VTTPARTVVDVARTSRGQGLVLADAALHMKLATETGLAEVIAGCGPSVRISQARIIVAAANALAESALESLTRLFLSDFGFPLPEGVQGDQSALVGDRFHT
jgi:hypothetical protein